MAPAQLRHGLCPPTHEVDTCGIQPALLVITYKRARQIPRLKTEIQPIRSRINYKKVLSNMPTAQSAEFKKAVEESRKLKAKPGDDELLQVHITRML